MRAPLTPILELGVGWNPELNAIDNTYLIGTVMGLSLGDIRRALDEILAFAELERFANLELRHFSSGMASRLAVLDRVQGRSRDPCARRGLCRWRRGIQGSM